MSKSFRDRIQTMNAMYKLPIHEAPHLFPDAEDRLLKFKRTLLDEVAEIDDITEQIRRGDDAIDVQAVSYTHLTLPTNREV